MARLAYGEKEYIEEWRNNNKGFRGSIQSIEYNPHWNKYGSLSAYSVWFADKGHPPLIICYATDELDAYRHCKDLFK